jgi:cellulose synthase operon protein C
MRIRVLRPLLIGAMTLHLAGCDLFIGAEQRVERAHKEIAKGNDRAAFVELQNAVRQEPQLVDARLILAELSLRLGDPKGAEKELNTAVQHGADPAQAAPIKAEVQLALGEHEALLKSIESGSSALVEESLATYRGLSLARSGQHGPAIDAYRKALKLNPELNRARVGLAESLVATGDSDEALKMLDATIEKNPRDAHALAVRGDLLLRRGDFADASRSLAAARSNAGGQLTVSQFASVLAHLTESQLGEGAIDGAVRTHTELAALAPDVPITRLLSARIAMAKHDYTAVVAESQKLVNSAPDLLQAKLLLSIGLMAQGSLHQAEVHLSDVVRRAPENTEARKLLARVNLQLQRPDIAMQLLTPLQQANDSDPQLAAMLGLASLQRGDSKQGVQLLEQGLARDPESASIKQELAGAYVAAGESQKALALLRSMKIDNPRLESMIVGVVASTEGVPSARKEMQRILGSDPSIEALSRGASYYALLSDFELARATIERAREKQPDNATTLVTLARIENAAGDVPKSKQAAEAALRVDPSNVTARMMIAELAVRDGDLDGASKQLEQVRASNAQAVEPRIALARVYTRQRKMREADAVLRELERQAAADAEIANAIGEVHREGGRMDDALRWFRESARQNPKDPIPQMNVARAQLAKGDSTLGRESLQKVITSNPDYVPAAAELILLDIRENRREAALGQLQKLKAAHPKNPIVALLEGEVAMSAKSYAAAAEAFEEAGKLAPSNTTAIRIYRARRLGGLPNPNQPLVSWLERNPDDVPVRLVLAESLETAGQKAQAIREYERLIEGDRPNPMALNNLAWLYHQQGDNRARALAKRAYDAAAQNAAIADTYGWILVQEDQVAEGLAILEKAAEAGQPDIRYHYAVALAKTGKSDQARRELSELIRTNGQYPVARDAQKLLDELGG